MVRKSWRIFAMAGSSPLFLLFPSLNPSPPYDRFLAMAAIALLHYREVTITNYQANIKLLILYQYDTVSDLSIRKRRIETSDTK